MITLRDPVRKNNMPLTGGRPASFWETAVQAAIRAGEIITDNIGRLSKDDIGLKDAADFVTRADREAEEVIIRTIREGFPDHSFLAEESARDQDTGGYRWIIDPLDGTTNFIHGYPMCAVSIALQEKGNVILGVIYDPIRDELFMSEKGKGAFLNGELITVSQVSDPVRSLIATGFPFRRRDLLEPYLELFRNIFEKVSDIRRAGSAALDLAYLAAGRCDGFFEIGLAPWDMAAGSLIVHEAGGVVTDFGGGDDFLRTGNIVAGNPAAHPLLLGEVKKVFSGRLER